MSDYAALLDALRALRWPARRPVRGGAPGAHHARTRGVSVEFTEYRPYRQGDDPRRIDWKLLARSDRAYIRLSTDRAVLPTTIVVDASASMAFPLDSLGKWCQAQRLAVGIAAVVHAQSDPVGLVLVTSAGTRTLAPRTRRGVVGELARTMDEATPGGSAPIAPALRALGGGRVVIVTDLLADGEAMLREGARIIAAGGDAHAVHVVAREELEPRGRALLAVDPEDETIRRPLDADARPAYERAFAEWRDATARAWRAAGAGYTMVVDDEPTERAVRRIVTGAAAP